MLVSSVLLVSHDGVPRVEDGFALSGNPPRALVLQDETYPLRTVCPLLGERFIVPVRGVSRFPYDRDWEKIGRVVLLGKCREWDYLVAEKGIPVSCQDD